MDEDDGPITAPRWTDLADAQCVSDKLGNQACIRLIFAADYWGLTYSIDFLEGIARQAHAESGHPVPIREKSSQSVPGLRP